LAGRPLLQPTTAANQRQRVVVLGTGWASRYLVDALDKDKYEVRIVSPRNFFMFTPLLPSTAAGTLAPSSVCSPVRELIR